MTLAAVPARPHYMEPSEAAPERRVFPCENGWAVSAIPQGGGFWEAIAIDNLGRFHPRLTVGPDHYDLSAADVEMMVDLAASMPVQVPCEAES